MNKQETEKIIKRYLKPIFGFALKRCKNIQDAEDLSQEILIKIYNALITTNIEKMDKFIWTIAHNMLHNYYRNYAKGIVNLPINEEIVYDDFLNSNEDAIYRLQLEIAYLSKIQREIIIAYYFENRKQKEIAQELNISMGTVKWHLFEAKKELKRRIKTMKHTRNLQFNPIRFDSYGLNGNIGTKSLDEFFRSSLSQNICYCIRNTAKTINEIANELNVSPVYIEDEVEFLEKYGFLKMQKNKYIANFIIYEPTKGSIALEKEMYQFAAERFANDLYDKLKELDILKYFQNSSLDDNFIMWSLIPYIAAFSNEKQGKQWISFEEVATIRPDGAHNIVYATVLPSDYNQDEREMKNWCGPMLNTDDKRMFWQIDSEWSNRGNNRLMQYPHESKRVLSLYEKDMHSSLSKDEYAWLVEHGYVQLMKKSNGQIRAIWQIVILKSNEMKEQLLEVGKQIKEKYQIELDKIKKTYIEEVLKTIPSHLKKVKEYEMQFIFNADGLFLYYCLQTLLKNHKLKLPKGNQKKAMMTIIAPI